MGKNLQKHNKKGAAGQGGPSKIKARAIAKRTKAFPIKKIADDEESLSVFQMLQQDGDKKALERALITLASIQLTHMQTFAAKFYEQAVI